MVAPRFQIYNHYRLAEDEPAARRALEDFQRAKQQEQAADETEDMDWSFYAELYDPQGAQPAMRDTSPPTVLKFEDRKLTGTVDSKGAGMLVLDLDGDGQPGLLVWSPKGIRLYRRGQELAPDSGLEELTNIISVAAGDFDNDGLPDLCVLTETGAHLYRNLKGRFAPNQAALPTGRYEAAVWMDFDHDYDLDLFLLGRNSALLRNDGGGKFEDSTAHFPFVRGQALSAAAFRSVPDSKGMDLAVTYEDRNSVLYRDRLRGEFEATTLDAIPPEAAGLEALDVANDGWMDLAFASAGTKHKRCAAAAGPSCLRISKTAACRIWSPAAPYIATRGSAILCNPNGRWRIPRPPGPMPISMAMAATIWPPSRRMAASICC
jgi:hypothetical protein